LVERGDVAQADAEGPDLLGLRRHKRDLHEAVSPRVKYSGHAEFPLFAVLVVIAPFAATMNSEFKLVSMTETQIERRENLPERKVEVTIVLVLSGSIRV